MAEIIMTFALGFLIASGLGLVLMVPVWRRAVNVTRKRLAASSPVSMDDFTADKDRMRAEFAMSARKLEMSVEALRKKAETRLAELDKREREIGDLQDEIDRTADRSALQDEEIADLRQRLATAEVALERRATEAAELKDRLADAQGVLSRQAVAIREANSLVEGHRDQIDVLTRDITTQTEDIAKKAAAIGERDAQLAKCGRSVAEQKMLVGELRGELAAKTDAIVSLTAERDAALAATSGTARRDAELARAHEETLGKLAAAEAELAALRENSNLIRANIETQVEVDRRDSAMLREKLGDLATEIERASDDLDAIVLSAAGHRPEGGRDWSPAANLRTGQGRSNGAEAPAPRPSSLAERIRALSGLGPA